MNRAWIIRAENRITHLEQVVRELKERIAQLESAPAIETPDEPVKRGPGRPRKVEQVAA